jgi:hypothetical protein
MSPFARPFCGVAVGRVRDWILHVFLFMGAFVLEATKQILGL